MSLIQDALKRQQEEAESTRVQLKSSVDPSVPAAMPVPPVTEPLSRPLTESSSLPPDRLVTSAGREKPATSWKPIAAIIICLLIVLAGAFFLTQSAVRASLGSFIPEMVKARLSFGKTVAPAPLPEAKPVVVPVRSSISKTWISAAAVMAPAFADEGEDAAENAALSGAKTQEELAAGAVVAILPQPSRASTPNNASVNQEDVRAKPAVWPRLKLSAVFSNAGSGQSGARLNNRLVLLGDLIEGVILVEIQSDGVVLKCGNETRSLRMGQTL